MIGYEQALRVIQTQLLSENHTFEETVTELQQILRPSRRAGAEDIQDEEVEEDEEDGVNEISNESRNETATGGMGVQRALGLAAMRWFLTLVDPSIVYEAALATYDMDLTLMVAALSQRDPREYRPFIEHLRAVPEG